MPINSNRRATLSAVKNPVMRSVLPFYPKYCLGHTEEELFLLSKNIFIRSKYPGKINIILKKTSWDEISTQYSFQLVARATLGIPMHWPASKKLSTSNANKLYKYIAIIIRVK